MDDLEFIDEEETTPKEIPSKIGVEEDTPSDNQPPKEFASQGEEETNASQGEDNFLEENLISPADIPIKKLEKIDKKDEEEIIKNEIIKPTKPEPLPDYNKRDYLPIKEKKKYFWKILAITSLILLILTIGSLIFLIKEGKLTPTFNSTNEIVNNYDFNPRISSPVTANLDNDFENNFEFTFDLSDEFIERVCGNNT